MSNPLPNQSPGAQQTLRWLKILLPRLLVIHILLLVICIDDLIYPIEFDVSSIGWPFIALALLLGTVLLFLIESLNRAIEYLFRKLQFRTVAGRYVLVTFLVYAIAGFSYMNMNLFAFKPNGERAFEFSHMMVRPVRLPGDLAIFGPRVSVMNYVYFPLFVIHRRLFPQPLPKLTPVLSPPASAPEQPS